MFKSVKWSLFSYTNVLTTSYDVDVYIASLLSNKLIIAAMQKTKIIFWVYMAFIISNDWSIYNGNFYIN